MKVWKGREEQIKTARIRWTWNETVTRTMMESLHREGDRKPSVDLLRPGICTVKLDGQKMRYEYEGQTWSRTEGEMRPRAFIATFNGTSYAYSSLKNAVTDHPEVTITGERATREIQYVSLAPLWSSLRFSLLEKSAFSIMSFIPANRTTTIQGRECQEFVSPPQANGVQEHMFIDVGRENQMVRRTTQLSDGVAILSIDIAYQPHSLIGWVPKSWEYVSRNVKGVTLTSGRCQVEELVINPDVQPEVFEPVLPPGARVVDVTSGREMHYGILPDGSKGKPLDGTRRIVEYAELYPKPSSSIWLSRYLLPAIAISLFMVAVLSLILIRHRLRTRPPATNQHE